MFPFYFLLASTRPSKVNPSGAALKVSSPARHIPTQEQPTAFQEISSQNYLKRFLGSAPTGRPFAFPLKANQSSSYSPLLH